MCVDIKPFLFGNNRKHAYLVHFHSKTGQSSDNLKTHPTGHVVGRMDRTCVRRRNNGNINTRGYGLWLLLLYCGWVSTDWGCLFCPTNLLIVCFMFHFCGGALVCSFVLFQAISFHLSLLLPYSVYPLCTLVHARLHVRP